MDIDDTAIQSLDDRMAAAWTWVSEHTPNPHPDLGRGGVVCPYMVRALGRKYVMLVPFDATDGYPALLAEARGRRAAMQARAESMTTDGMYLVTIVVPYGLPDDELRPMVIDAHNELRAEFVQLGYVPGDFWPDHETTGLHSDAFRPFSSPVPMLGMRALHPADLVFFCKHERDPQRKITYLRYYRDFFGDQLNEYWTRMLAEAETETELALAAR